MRKLFRWLADWQTWIVCGRGDLDPWLVLAALVAALVITLNELVAR
ncbi:MAG TPA: hypothetical protein PKD09_09490 [Aggregatilinea sp.]|nr:hypothetical protein [Aggregatilinea sp.]HML21870.1 hypothetical protein [Aggregatilinea sp.]